MRKSFVPGADGLLLAWLLVVSSGCVPEVRCPPVASQGQERQPLTAAEGQAARVDNLRFAAFCFPDGDAWVLLLEVTSLGGEGVLVAREPDEFSGHYISNTVQGAPWGFLKARVRTRDASGQRRPAQLDYSPVNFVYLEAGDCFRRRCRLAVSNVSGIRDLRMTYFVHDGPSFRHKPFAGEVLLPEVPLLERPAGGGDVRDGTVGR